MYDSNSMIYAEGFRCMLAICLQQQIKQQGKTSTRGLLDLLIEKQGYQLDQQERKNLYKRVNGWLIQLYDAGLLQREMVYKNNIGKYFYLPTEKLSFIDVRQKK